MVTEWVPSRQTDEGDWLNESDGVTVGVTVTLTVAEAVHVFTVSITE
jgi:hypothetical protein